MLVGELDLDTVHAVLEQAHAVTLWTLATMYGMEQYRYHHEAPEPVRWSIHVDPSR
ncbi:hypothetical protein [Phycicoccus sp.]|uniref:hypothetical protein n=1 Tax=Phycicoccus sp. TaxID=1902410 RepID=UPI002BF1BADA|nr:hypothetical protein [Phycicoccus sp.]HMM95334.1 hypothetical protein [Phycicoccus sp.]